jgi:hypothetical protein
MLDRNSLVPCFDASSTDITRDAFAETFQRFRVVHVRNVTKGLVVEKGFTWRDICATFVALDSSDKDSWCIETKSGAVDPCPADFLKPVLTQSRAYCSFLVQKDKHSYKKTLASLPMLELRWTDWTYEPALWIFFGRNGLGNSDLEGRPEHTDSISHDGTWHYQLSGRKLWFLRPSSRLLEHLDIYLSPDERKMWNDSTSVCIECEENDVIVIE